MSVEYRPVPAIPFKVIDKRLEKYGIKVELSGPTTALIGSHGTLFAKPEGNSTHFERKLGIDVQTVLDAIETEYGITIVDENDHRFWGFASHDDMVAACRGLRSEVQQNRPWYQMKIPKDVNIGAIRNALLQSAETEDKDGVVHPERLLVTMSRKEVEDWKHRLKIINWHQRLADRELLLDT